MAATTVTHKTYSPDANYENFTRRFEKQCGIHDGEAYRALLADPKNNEKTQSVIAAQAGASGFMIFAFYDHGALLNLKNAPRKAKQYVVGNPLIAARMTAEDIRAGLYAPLRVLVYEDDDSKLKVDYDLPSTLFGQFKNRKIDAVARELDAKLEGLIQNASRSSD